MNEGRKYIKYLVLSLVALAFFFGASTQLSEQQDEILLSPGGEPTTASKAFNFYTNFSPLITGILIVASVLFLILIVVESIRHK